MFRLFPPLLALRCVYSLVWLYFGSLDAYSLFSEPSLLLLCHHDCLLLFHYFFLYVLYMRVWWGQQLVWWGHLA